MWVMVMIIHFDKLTRSRSSGLTNDESISLTSTLLSALNLSSQKSCVGRAEALALLRDNTASWFCDDIWLAAMAWAEFAWKSVTNVGVASLPYLTLLFMWQTDSFVIDADWRVGTFRNTSYFDANETFPAAIP